jgi:predicted DNA-binding protein (MmcQ/YjbR family)
MTLEALRSLCRALPEVTEDVKWGGDLCFCIRKKMFAVVNLEPPHQLAFKCTPESFGELVERPGIIPAPYMARHLWVQEEALGDALARGELEHLVRASYELVVATLPKSKRPGVAAASTKKTTRPAGRRRAAPGGRKRTATRARRRR